MLPLSDVGSMFVFPSHAGRKGHAAVTLLLFCCFGLAGWPSRVIGQQLDLFQEPKHFTQAWQGV
ncbi:MAG TPA: hypothetical protein PL064_10195, partial [Thermogutta sp.]|nr:hypothetical protein [Thermogutta sp.]